jgi:hypothetical protein
MERIILKFALRNAIRMWGIYSAQDSASEET